MVDPQVVLTERVQRALGAAFGPEYADADPLIRPSQFADYQANVALSLAKRLRRAPRDVAQALVDALDVADVCAGVEVSGPGFVNLTLADTWIAGQAEAMRDDEALGVARRAPQTVVIDYSAPNAAKEMHVGHLRTTIVGDALARVHEHVGDHVIRQNHLGDWGTPFGMLMEHLLDVGEEEALRRLASGDGNAFYQEARHKFDTDPAFEERARRRVPLLQGGDPESMRLWHEFIEHSKRYFNQIYRELGVTLTDEHIAGESMYNPMLADVCDELERAGIARISDGALCVFPPGFTGRDDQPLPLIIRKSDGGYGYATTDLAAIRYRVRELKADRILYVVGATQALHFQMVFATARMAGWLTDDVRAEHVQIGNVLGEDGKIFRTRSGKSIKLSELLEEAVERAEAVIADRGYDPETRKEIARKVGIGAVKYADLSVSHDSEYVFDFDRMLALTGNTGPYLQYATARIRSIFRKGGIDPEQATGAIRLGEPAERALALTLLGYPSVVEKVAEASEPHRLCTFLFELAQAFTGFYESCPVLTAEDPAVRESRLALSALTLRVLLQGLDLLGIEVPERM
ncbi:arginine--tRNA ligase [Thermopolyspora flexuosa]|uniref:Arginine--tRNA ligase n=1 Tax=Thermopolyspora flexuosa TaxID=103836 RepID=A0A543IP57_9ACTN|nr:arginine--tRNA ligase [Thermopolyspora flexuosa]TQM72373.1 arginyl-tRNA synthetase [Thermopolyspora flexuosa]GGM80285.1 arginine--tRNA ligase [Thermopolyspora flexuosa]